jgi:hypothetical protein
VNQHSARAVHATQGSAEALMVVPPHPDMQLSCKCEMQQQLDASQHDNSRDSIQSDDDAWFHA